MAKKIIYADNAATSPMSTKAFEVMVEFLKQDFANASQPYAFARSAKKALRDARTIIAECIGAQPNEIYFTSCGTESDNWVIKQCRNETIITSAIEHHAVLNSCLEKKLSGYNVKILPVSDKGVVETAILEKNIVDNSLVSVMFSNNEIGSIQPIKELAKVAHAHNSLFHTDAVQAVGHVNIDVKDLDVDFLSASAHKFNGPKGIGFLYIKNGIELKPLINGGAQENGLRAGTENVAAIIAMAIALKENSDSIKTNEIHLLKLESVLLSTLQKSHIDFVRNGDRHHTPGNLSLSFSGYSGESLLHLLDLVGICVSTGSACDSKETHISHVLKAIGLSDSLAKGTIRISLSKFNTVTEVRSIATALIRILKR